MLARLSLLFLLAAPFWDSKPPESWTLEEARSLLLDSPWAQNADASVGSSASPVPVYIATAEPVIHAEDRLRASRKTQGDDPAWTEYRDYLAENAGKYIVLAIAVTKAQAFLDNSETTHMENESTLVIGKRKYQVTGSFAPSKSDPFARLVFPRDVRDTDKTLRFDLYVPGTGTPYREAEFELKTMRYQGRPSF